jgi:hypothetical protein
MVWSNYSARLTRLTVPFRPENIDMFANFRMPVSLKDKCVDALLLAMVLISVTGLIYALWYR